MPVILEALNLRFACDQSSRTSMPNLGTEDEVILYKGNPHFIQAALFTGVPASGTFVDDLSNISGASLLIRKHNSKGTVLIEKVLDPDEINGALTYSEWVAGTSQHLQFELSDVDTNQTVPSDKTLDIYGAITVSTPAGPITIGTFTGIIKDDGTGNPGDPVVPDYTTYSRAEIDNLLANISPAQGLGNVTGPNGATVNRIAIFDALSGQSIADSGVLLSDLATVATTMRLVGDQNAAGVKTYSASPVVPDVTALDATGKVANTNFVTTAIATLSTTLTTSIATKQAADATLSALAGVTTAADKLIYATGADAFATTTLSAFARTILDDADAATMRATLGVGTGTGDASTNASVSVDSELVLFNSTSGKSLKRASGSGLVLSTSGVASFVTDSRTSWDTAYSERHQWDGGITNLVAATARTSLGLVIGTNVQAYSANLAAVAGVASVATFGRDALAISDASAFRTYIGVGTGSGDISSAITSSTIGRLAVFSATTGKGIGQIGTTTLRGMVSHLWLAVRTDGIAGTGTAEDPFDCGGSTAGIAAAKFDTIINAATSGTYFHLMSNGSNPTVFYTKGCHDGQDTTYEAWLKANCVMEGPGVDLVSVRLSVYPSAFFAVYSGAGRTWSVLTQSAGEGTSRGGVTIKGLTVDANWQNLGQSDSTTFALNCVSLHGSNNTVQNVRSINFFGHVQECFANMLNGEPTVGGTNSWFINCEIKSPRGDYTNGFCVFGNNETTGRITNSGAVGCRVSDALSNGAYSFAGTTNCSIINSVADGVTRFFYTDTGSNYGTVIRGCRGLNLITRGIEFNCSLGVASGDDHIRDLVIDNNTFDTPTSAGIAIQVISGRKLRRMRLTNNTITSGTTADDHGAIFVSANAGDAYDLTVTNNTIRASDIGLSIDKRIANVLVADNDVFGCRVGIYAAAGSSGISSNYQLISNRIYSPSLDGINLGSSAGTGFLIKRNEVYSAGRYGVGFSGSGDHLLIDNMFDATTSGYGDIGTTLRVNRGNKKRDGSLIGTETSLIAAEFGATAVGRNTFLCTTPASAALPSYSSAGAITMVTMAAGESIRRNAGDTAFEAFTPATVSDTTFAGSWDGVTTVAPSKNTVYDKFQSVVGALSDFAVSPTSHVDFSASGWRTDLALVIGTNVQAYDADLTTWAGVTPGTGVATALAVANNAAGGYSPIDGTATLSNKTLTAPKIAHGGFIADANGNEQIIFSTTSNAVNEFTFSNAATGNTPTILATGGDTNIGLKFTTKGSAGISLTPNGSEATAANPTLFFSTDTATGWSRLAANQWHWVSSGTALFGLYNSQIRIGGGLQLQFCSGGENGGGDVALSRDGASGFQINNTTAGAWGYLKLGVYDAGTTTTTDGLIVGHRSSGTPAAGLGTAILFNLDSTTTANQNAARISSLWTTATHASRTADLVFSTVYNATALAESFRIQQLSTGTIATFGGTSASFPALKRSTDTLQVRVADDSTFADLAVKNIYSNDSGFVSRSSVTLDDGTGPNVGTLGNAPSVGNPSKWVALYDNGTTRWIPTWEEA